MTNSVHIVGCDLNEYETCLGGDRVTSFSEQCGGRVLCWWVVFDMTEYSIRFAVLLFTLIYFILDRAVINKTVISIWSNTACGTYTWARSPALSRYDCFTESTIWSMLDAPAVLIQESIFSKTFRVPTPPYVSTSITAAGPSTTADGTPRNTIGEDNSGGNPGDTPAANLASKTQILAGSIVGGTVGLLLILFLFCARRRIVCGLKSKRDIKDTGTPKVAQVGDNQKGFWNLKPELDATTVRAELEGAPGEERDAGIRVWKPELEGTPGIPGLSGIYVRKKSELEACGLAAQSGSRDIAAGPSSIEDRRHTSVQLKTSGVHEMAA